MIEVTLTAWEFKAAVDLASTRMAVSNDRGMNHASTYKRTYLERLEEETVGACSEIAVGKALNWFVSPSVNTFHRVADVGQRVEVRGTKLDNGSLIIRDNDADDRWYILVTGEPPNMVVRGRIRGDMAKRDEWVRDPHGRRKAWFVPQNALLPLGD